MAENIKVDQTSLAKSEHAAYKNPFAAVKIKDKMKKRVGMARAAIAKKKAARFIINPRRPTKLTWDSLNVIISGYSMAEIFYSIAFEEYTCDWTHLVIVEFFIDCFFMCDTLLNFFTSYEDPATGDVVDRHVDICRNYLFGWFSLDLVSSFPFNRVSCAFSQSSEDQNKIRLLKGFRLLKAARILRMVRTAARLEEELGHLIHNTVRFVKFFGMMALFIHLCACVWFATIYWTDCQIPEDYPVVGYAPCGCDSAQGCRDWNWLIKYAGGQAQYEQFFAQNRSMYVVSLYYSIVTLTTLGYGDLTPSNDTEHMVSSALALGGAIMFSILIGSIGALITKNNVIEVLIEEDVSKTVDLCRFGSMSQTIEKRVHKQIGYIGSKTPHRFAEVSMLPRTVQNEVMNEVGKELFGKIEFFKMLNTDYRGRLAQILRPCIFQKGDYIFRALDIATELYWVVRGQVSIVKQKEKAAAHNTMCNMEDAKHPSPGKHTTASSGRLGERHSNTNAGNFDIFIHHGIAIVEAGSIFGDLELFSVEEINEKLATLNGRQYSSKHPTVRVYAARAKTRCELLELRKQDLETVIRPLMPDLYKALLERAAHKALFLVNEVPEHEAEVEAVYGRRQEHWDALAEHERQLSQVLASGRLRSPELQSELVVLNGGLGSVTVPESHCDLDVAGATSTRAPDRFAGVAGWRRGLAAHVHVASATVQPPTPPALKGIDRDQGGDQGGGLEALREEVREMRVQLAQILSALASGPCSNGTVSMPVRDAV